MNICAESSLRLRAELIELRALTPWLTALLAAGDAQAMYERLELALHEICVNVVEHAYSGREGFLDVEGLVHSDRIELRVLDSGHAFDPASYQPPQDGIPQLHGYGLMIVRQLVDDVVYNNEKGQNSWTLLAYR